MNEGTRSGGLHYQGALGDLDLSEESVQAISGAIERLWFGTLDWFGTHPIGALAAFSFACLWLMLRYWYGEKESVRQLEYRERRESARGQLTLPLPEPKPRSGAKPKRR